MVGSALRSLFVFAAVSSALHAVGAMLCPNSSNLKISDYIDGNCTNVQVFTNRSVDGMDDAELQCRNLSEKSILWRLPILDSREKSVFLTKSLLDVLEAPNAFYIGLRREYPKSEIQKSSFSDEVAPWMPGFQAPKTGENSKDACITVSVSGHATALGPMWMSVLCDKPTNVPVCESLKIAAFFQRRDTNDDELFCDYGVESPES